MEPLDNGLLNLKIKLCLPLLLALRGVSLSDLRLSPGGPPRTPQLPRKHLEGDQSRHQRTPHRHPQQPPDYEVDDDEDNKENIPQNPEQRDPEWGPTLRQLLTKWDEDLNRLQRTVYHDLEDYRKRLGIHQ
ncbi:E4 [Gammapapillomavirus 14]|uniref:E4 n=1 Tax=Gammapapillomavirus 14 TaxID=1513259 RepID=A0A2D2ALR3_9PAPI|nr:E4 [Gammapapillomavirus 14]